MTDISPLVARITAVGMSKVFTAVQAGLKVNFAQIALGHGINNVGYNPTGAEVALKTEFARMPIASADKVENTIVLQGALFAPHNEQGWVSEIGLILDDGTLFAVYSEANKQISYVGTQDTIIHALTMGLDELPSGSVSWTAGGPSVNILMGEAFANLAFAIGGLQQRVLASEVNRLSPQVQSLQAGK